MKKSLACIASILLGSSTTFASPAPSPSAADREAVTLINADISRMAKEALGVVGVAAWRLDRQGPVIGMALDEPFPMASTLKVAVAAKIFSDVDAGKVRLDQMVTLDEDMRVPSDLIADRIVHPGVSLSVYNWLELMLTESDNTATDTMIKLGGGPASITAWAHGHGIDDYRLDDDIAGSLERFLHLPNGPFNKVYKAAVDAGQTPDGSHTPHGDFDNSPLDTVTPRGMANLLTGIFSGKMLSPASTQAMIGIMQRTRTGLARIRGRMPTGTVVADKTGTLGGSVNDVGVVTLPDDQGQIVIAVFIKKSGLDELKREAVIADIARSLREYFLFTAPALTAQPSENK